MMVKTMKTKSTNNQYLSPEDENVDANFACELTKLNFEKACADTYSQIVAEITHSARCGLSMCEVGINADDNMLAWLDEKFTDKGFDVKWSQYDCHPLQVDYTVKW